MVSRVAWLLRDISRHLWVRSALISGLAVLAAGLAPILAGMLPSLAYSIEAAELRGLLATMTNSMLAVTTFSLTVMVTTHLHADTAVTPRSHRLLREDTRTQTVLATFIGAFVFGLTAQFLLDAGLIGEGDYGVVYVVAMAVFALIVVAILRWIAHLAGLGSVEQTLRRVEEAAREAIELRMAAPHLGGRRLADPRDIPDPSHSVAATRSGFVQHVDTRKLSDMVGDWGGTFFVLAMPGDWVNAGQPLGEVVCDTFDDAREAALSDAFVLGDVRTYSQDTGFGLIVLAEIAQRALSPGINDPRTALDVVSRLVRLCADLVREDSDRDVPAPNVVAPAMNIGEVMERAFDPIARDGRGFVEVQLHIQTALDVLAQHRTPDVAQAARILARRGLAYAEAGLMLEEDLARVRAASPVQRAPGVRSVSTAIP